MNIKKEIKENYEIAKSKGFYPDDSKIEDHLMGIVSELGEAYEAHRGGKFCQSIDLEASLETECFSNYENLRFYRMKISGTFEDELADVFIRLFNLMGHYDISSDNNWFIHGIKEVDLYIDDNFLLNHSFFQIHIVNRFSKLSNKVGEPYPSDLGKIYQMLIEYCKYHNIPIEKHIQAKKQYNKYREHLHGKKY